MTQDRGLEGTPVIITGQPEHTATADLIGFNPDALALNKKITTGHPELANELIIKPRVAVAKESGGNPLTGEPARVAEIKTLTVLGLPQEQANKLSPTERQFVYGYLTLILSPLYGNNLSDFETSRIQAFQRESGLTEEQARTKVHELEKTVTDKLQQKII